MKRPQSAKPGYRAPMLQNSSDDIKQEEFSHKNLHRKQVKLLKPDLTTNDFARIMPKKIYQDKQRLYSQGLQLKQKLNELMEENIRLKTRISILEKQKDKLTKAIDNAAQPANKSQSRFKAHTGQSNDKQSAMVVNLKKIIRESKQQNEYLRQQNAKIKKAVKFTKVNQVQIECKILREQYQKLQQILVQMNEKLQDQDEFEKQIGQLKKYLQQQIQANKQLSDSNQKYVQYIQQLEQKVKNQTEKASEKQKKLNRELALQKRKLNEQIKVCDDLRKELRAKQAPIDQKKKPITGKPLVRPASSHPFSKQQPKQQDNNAQKQTQKKLDQMKNQNEKLEKQLKQIKQKLEQAERQKQNLVHGKKEVEKKKQQHSYSPKKNNLTNNKQLRVQSQPKQDYDDEQFEQPAFVLNQSKKKKDDQKANDKQDQAGFILNQSKKKSKQDNNYDEEFDELQQTSKDKKQKNNDSGSKKKADTNVILYNKDLQQDGEEEQLYRKQIKKESKKEAQKKQHKQKKANKEKKEDKKQQKSKKKSNSKYEPNKAILNQIKQLLTYRMIAQRYPYEQLQKDILSSNQTNFKYVDLQSMLKMEPFYLTPAYANQFLQYIFQSCTPSTEDSTTTQVLLKKIRKVIKDFELADEKQQQTRLINIAEMTTKYSEQLQSAFQKIKNGPETVSKKQLSEMFRKLQLADEFIEIIISELSLVSDDLEHLSIRGFFQRFYIPQMESQNNSAINEEQVQSSGEHHNTGKNKINKIDQQQQYEDDKVNFILDNEAELSMRGKGGAYNEDIISDDGHV